MSKLAVRQAIEYAINKSDLQKVMGGPAINKLISTAIPPGNAGYQPYNLYPTPGNSGNPGQVQVPAGQRRLPARPDADRPVLQRHLVHQRVRVDPGQPDRLRHYSVVAFG